MSFTPDWNTICIVVWGLITIHWSITLMGQNKKVDPIGAVIPFLVGYTVYFLSNHFGWPMGLNLVILAICLIGFFASFDDTMDAAKSYSNVWKSVGPTVKQDWTMALPVMASIFLFWM